MAKKLEKTMNGLKRVRPSDFMIISLVVILVIFGVVMVFSASYYKSINEAGTPYSYLQKQAFFAITGFVIMYIASVMDYHIWRKLSPFLLVGSLGLLLAIFTPLGINVNGATRWIGVGPITIMPGEVSKIAVIAFVATYLSDKPERILSFFKGVLPLAVLAGLFGGLIVLQPNLSTAITVVGIVFGMMFLAGLQWRWVILAFALGGAGIGYILQADDSNPSIAYWQKRLTSFVDPFKDPQGDGFQAVQSLLALGTGGLFGLGLGKSVQKNLYLPEPQNDFILAIIGEELGFVAILLLLAVFLLLVWRCFLVSMNAPDQFGMLLAGGVTLMLGIQVVLNVAVVTSSMPPTGIAMPFISYGGNALWIFMGAIGVVLNVSRNAVTKPPEENAASTRAERIRRRKERESLI